VFKSSPSQGSAAISSKEARLSGSRISIRAISLQTCTDQCTVSWSLTSNYRIHRSRRRV
jgi:hypothetical protein